MTLLLLLLWLLQTSPCPAAPSLNPCEH